MGRLGFVLLLLLSAAVFGNSLSVSSDKSIYAVGEAAAIKARLSYDNGSAVAGSPVTFGVYLGGVLNHTNSSTTDSEGVASLYYTIPATGNYSVRANTSVFVETSFRAVSEIKFCSVYFTRESEVFKMVTNISGTKSSLSPAYVNFSSSDISSKSGIYHFGTFQAPGGLNLSVLVADPAINGSYDTVYFDDDPYFNLTNDTEDQGIGNNFTEFTNLKEFESWASNTEFAAYTPRFFKIQRDGNLLVAAFPSNASVYSPSDVINYLALCENSSGILQDNMSISLNVLNGNRTSISSKSGTTDSGIFKGNFTAGSAGTFFLDINNGLGSAQVVVSDYVAYLQVTDTQGRPQYQFGSDAILLVNAKTKTRGGNPANATSGTVTVYYPNGTSASASLEAVAIGEYKARFDFSGLRSGTYAIVLEAVVDGATLREQTGFTVVSSRFELMPVNIKYVDKEGMMYGFAPEDPIAIVVFNYDISTGSLTAFDSNYSDSTNDCANQVSLLEVRDGRAYSAAELIPQINNLWNFTQQAGVPPPPEEGFLGQCLIIFNPIGETGNYVAKIKIKKDSEVSIREVGFPVMGVYAKAYPVDSSGDKWWFFTPGSAVSLKIDAYELANSSQLSAEKISDVRIEEVRKMEEGPGQLVTIPRDSIVYNQSTGVLSFNSSQASGTYRVAFSFRANVSGRDEVGSGEGWFETLAYYVGGTPSKWRFGRTENVTMEVTVARPKDMASGISGENDITVTVEELWNHMLMKRVYANASIGRTVNGTATITILPPAGGWESGWYGVKLLANKSGTTSTGWGGFEVRNFYVQVFGVDLSIMQETDQFALGSKIPLLVSARKPESDIGLPITAYTVSSIDDMRSWPPRKVFYNQTAYNLTIEVEPGMNVSLPFVNISGLPNREGNYRALVTVDTPLGSDSGEFWFSLTQYSLDTVYWEGDFWPPTFGPNSNITINISASSFGSSGGYNLSSLRLSRVWSEKLGRESTEGFNLSGPCLGSRCDAVLSLRNMPEGKYDVGFTVTDYLNGTKDTGIFFVVKSSIISIPVVDELREMGEYGSVPDPVGLDTNDRCRARDGRNFDNPELAAPNVLSINGVDLTGVNSSLFHQPFIIQYGLIEAGADNITFRQTTANIEGAPRKVVRLVVTNNVFNCSSSCIAQNNISILLGGGTSYTPGTVFIQNTSGQYQEYNGTNSTHYTEFRLAERNFWLDTVNLTNAEFFRLQEAIDGGGVFHVEVNTSSGQFAGAGLFGSPEYYLFYLHVQPVPLAWNSTSGTPGMNQTQLANGARLISASNESIKINLGNPDFLGFYAATPIPAAYAWDQTGGRLFFGELDRSEQLRFNYNEGGFTNISVWSGGCEPQKNGEEIQPPQGQLLYSSNCTLGIGAAKGFLNITYGPNGQVVFSSFLKRDVSITQSNDNDCGDGRVSDGFIDKCFNASDYVPTYILADNTSIWVGNDSNSDSIVDYAGVPAVPIGWQFTLPSTGLTIDLDNISVSDRRLRYSAPGNGICFEYWKESSQQNVFEVITLPQAVYTEFINDRLYGWTNSYPGGGIDRQFYDMLSLMPPSGLFIAANTSHLWVSEGTDLSGVNATPVGGTFTDAEGGVWNVSSIQLSKQQPQVSFKGVSVLNNGIKVNVSLSRSGYFKLMQPLDESQLSNNCGKDGCQQNGYDIDRNGNKSNLYFVLMFDSAKPNSYDAVIFSKNLSFTSPPARLSDNFGNKTLPNSTGALHLLSVDARGHNVFFYEENPGQWAWFGTQKIGENITIPILVIDPSSGTPKFNVSVGTVSAESQEGMFSTKIGLTAASPTNDKGIAEIRVKFDNPGGYRIAITANGSMMEDWKWPFIEVRSYLTESMRGTGFKLQNFTSINYSFANQELIKPFWTENLSGNYLVGISEPVWMWRRSSSEIPCSNYQAPNGSVDSSEQTIITSDRYPNTYFWFNDNTNETFVKYGGCNFSGVPNISIGSTLLLNYSGGWGSPVEFNLSYIYHGGGRLAFGLADIGRIWNTPNGSAAEIQDDVRYQWYGFTIVLDGTKYTALVANNYSLPNFNRVDSLYFTTLGTNFSNSSEKHVTDYVTGSWFIMNLMSPWDQIAFGNGPVPFATPQRIMDGTPILVNKINESSIGYDLNFNGMLNDTWWIVGIDDRRDGQRNITRIFTDDDNQILDWDDENNYIGGVDTNARRGWGNLDPKKLRGGVTFINGSCDNCRGWDLLEYNPTSWLLFNWDDPSVTSNISFAVQAKNFDQTPIANANVTFLGLSKANPFFGTMPYANSGFSVQQVMNVTDSGGYGLFDLIPNASWSPGEYRASFNVSAPGFAPVEMDEWFWIGGGHP